MCLCGVFKVSTRTDGGERDQVPVELKLQVVRHPAWVLGIELRFCVKAVHALHC